MKSLREVQTLQLASLLHDIGKFYQRTGLPPNGYEDFGEDDHGPHGAHAKWSAAFVSEYVPRGWRKGLAPILYHHKPQDAFSKLIAVADWLSAGEREKGKQYLLPTTLHLRVHQNPHNRREIGKNKVPDE